MRLIIIGADLNGGGPQKAGEGGPLEEALEHPPINRQTAIMVQLE